MIDDSIHNDQKRKEQEKLELLLLEALEEGNVQEVTPKFFEQLRERARQLTEHASPENKNIRGGTSSRGHSGP